MEKKEKNKNEEIKLVIFYDDDEQKKEKYALILERTLQGIKIKLCDKDTLMVLPNAQPFEIPNHRLLKIKDVEVKPK